ncbi:hypothetical protein FB567DRAFT_548654 [Paraphoma chrysanthemicola]|uniref:F-box domain-containing protein n=1 Tax=Paraphoma chrysanthemicola TaxID=798071 RepID=A0A8K0VYL4_9PLEO|nr:hypothetical protein FB567DRAFT_548654 [Paraphoma chrysanthemicola]
MSFEPFPFLDLPTELRCMVYDELTASEVRATLPHMFDKKTRTKKNPDIVAIRSGLPVSLLATCKFINNEAKPWFDKELEKMKGEPIRLEVVPRVRATDGLYWLLLADDEDTTDGKPRSDYLGRKVQFLRDTAASNPHRIDVEVLGVGNINHWVKGPMKHMWHTLFGIAMRFKFATVFKGRVTQNSTAKARDEWEELQEEALIMAPGLRFEEMVKDKIAGSVSQG